MLNTLFGLRRDFPQALRALIAAQAGLAIVLASLAPFTLLWYASSADYYAALRFNGLMFAVASLMPGNVCLGVLSAADRAATAGTGECCGRGWRSTFSSAFKWLGCFAPSSAIPACPCSSSANSWGNAYEVWPS